MNFQQQQQARKAIAKSRRRAHVKLFARSCDRLGVNALTAAHVAHETTWAVHAQTGDLA